MSWVALQQHPSERPRRDSAIYLCRIPVSHGNTYINTVILHSITYMIPLEPLLIPPSPSYSPRIKSVRVVAAFAWAQALPVGMQLRHRLGKTEKNSNVCRLCAFVWFHVNMCMCMCVYVCVYMCMCMCVLCYVVLCYVMLCYVVLCSVVCVCVRVCVCGVCVRLCVCVWYDNCGCQIIFSTTYYQQ